MIFVNRPYLFTVDQAGQLGSKIELFIWNGSTPPTNPNYTFTKQIASATDTANYYNISPFLAEFIQFGVTDTNSATLLEDNYFVNYRIKNYYLDEFGDYQPLFIGTPPTNQAMYGDYGNVFYGGLLKEDTYYTLGGCDLNNCDTISVTYTLEGEEPVTVEVESQNEEYVIEDIGTILKNENWNVQQCFNEFAKVTYTYEGIVYEKFLPKIGIQNSENYYGLIEGPNSFLISYQSINWKLSFNKTGGSFDSTSIDFETWTTGGGYSEISVELLTLPNECIIISINSIDYELQKWFIFNDKNYYYYTNENNNMSIGFSSDRWFMEFGGDTVYELVSIIDIPISNHWVFVEGEEYETIETKMCNCLQATLSEDTPCPFGTYAIEPGSIFSAFSVAPSGLTNKFIFPLITNFPYRKVRWTNLYNGTTETEVLIINKLYSINGARYANGTKVELLDSVFNTVVNTWTFLPKCECTYEPIKVQYLNTYGALITTWFYKANKKEFSMENSEFKRFQTVDSNFYVGKQRQTFNTSAREKITVNSDWVLESYSQVIKDIITSEYTLVNDQFANVETKSIEIQQNINNGLINYQLTFTYSNDYRR